MIIAEFNIIPLGTKTPSVSKYVKAVVQELEKNSEIKVIPGAMGTILESNSLEKIFRAIERARERVFDMGVERVVISIRIDERRDKEISVESKIKAIKE